MTFKEKFKTLLEAAKEKRIAGIERPEFMDKLNSEFTNKIPEVEKVIEPITNKTTSKAQESVKNSSVYHNPSGKIWKPSELYKMEKTLQLQQEIKSANIDQETKKFLLEAATRHTVFNYSKIADFYAQQPNDEAGKKVQELMEKSALVLIDIDTAIQHGYTKFKTLHDQIIEEDSQNGNEEEPEDA